MHRRQRSYERQAIKLVACLGAAAVAAGVLVPAGWAAPAADVLAEQATLVRADHQPAIDAAARAVAGAQSALAAAEARRSSDQALAAGAAARVAADQGRLTDDTGRLAAAVTRRGAADAAVATDQGRMRAIAVQLYVSPQGAPQTAGANDLAAQQEEMFASVDLALGASGVEERLHQDLSERTAARLAVDRYTSATGADRTALDAATTARDNSRAVLASDQTAVAGAQGTLGSAQSASAAAIAASDAAVAALANPPGTPADGTPSVLGAAALTPAQMVGWYNSQGYSDLTTAPIDQLAAWYVSEGKAEGVRGDVAFAQAMVETGGFASPDAVNLSNFAGIGHCDSCGAGIAFPSPQMGVRAQIQLLRSFADPNLTTAGLGEPLVSPALAPETEPARGCCQTWQSLTGRWATDPIYGQTIMNLYGQMLAFALARLPGH